MTSTPTVARNPRLLHQSIAAVILAFIPLLCVGGGIIEFITLRKAFKAKDTITQVLSIIALVVGVLMTRQTVLVLIFFFLNAFQAAPVFEPTR
jgi:uncharacterized membrane protein YidH (DUF202 family)